MFPVKGKQMGCVQQKCFNFLQLYGKNRILRSALLLKCFIYHTQNYTERRC